LYEFQRSEVELIRLPAHPRKRQEHAQILKAVKEYLGWNRWKVKRFSQGPFAEPGVPDLCAMRSGVFVWIEIKTPQDSLSKAQREFKRDCEEVGIPHFVVRSIDEALLINNAYPEGRKTKEV
jgi:hypothetical protein